MATNASPKQESPPDKSAPKLATVKPDGKTGDARKADAKADAKGGDAQPKTGSRSKRKLVLVLVLLLVVAAASGGAWYFTQHSAEAKAGEETESGTQEQAGSQEQGGTQEQAESEGGDQPKAKAGPQKPPLFVNLDPFTVNLQREENDQFLQTTLVLRTSGTAAQEAIKLYMPVIRSNVLLLLSSKRASEIRSAEEKQKLAAEIAEAVRKSVAAPAAEDISGVFFTSFLVQ